VVVLPRVNGCSNSILTRDIHYGCFYFIGSSLFYNPPIDYKMIGQRIQCSRKAAGMTQETLSEKVSISVVYLSKIENGKVSPKSRIIV